MTNRRGLVLLAAAVALLPGSVRAQCDGAAAVGDLGISRLECDCVVAPAAANTRWQFWTEPRILRVESGSAAAGKLQVGDVIVSVNGHAVTSQEGADALASIRPDQPVAVTVRREGHEHHYLLRPEAACPTSPTLLGAVAPVQRVQVSATTPATAAGQRVRSQQDRQALTTAERARTEERAAATARAAGSGLAAARVTTAPGASGQQPGSGAGAPRAYAMPASAAAWIGIAFSCSNCGVVMERNGPLWFFSSPPEVYSVEPGSPAYVAGIRRGDVLTHVNNIAIATPEGGRKWAALKPGESVRVRYQRGAAVRTVVLRAAAAPGAMYATSRSPGAEYQMVQSVLATRDSATARLLREYERSLQQQRGEQERALKSLQAQLGSQSAQERAEAQRKLHELLTEQQKLTQKHYEEVQRLRLTESRLQESYRRALVQYAETEAPLTRAQGAARAKTVVPSEQRLRYSGTVRGTEVEVRGTRPVVVSEQADEIVITTSETTIRIKVPRQR